MRSGAVPGLGGVVRVLLLVGCAVTGLLPGCREAPITFAAVPGPALSDDLALAERRAGRELTSDEFDAFLEAHDRYLAAWLDTIRREAEPLARDVRAGRYGGSAWARVSVGRKRNWKTVTFCIG